MAVPSGVNHSARDCEHCSELRARAMCTILLLRGSGCEERSSKRTVRANACSQLCAADADLKVVAKLHVDALCEEV